MAREWQSLLVVCAAAGPLAGCSLILDFGESAVPIDAAIDAPFSQAECDYLEPNNTAAEAAMLAVTDVGPAAICPGDTEDRDFYKFTVPAGITKVTIRIAFKNMSGDLDLRLSDPTGATILGTSRGFVDDEVLVCPGQSPMCPTLAEGDYVFEVFPAVPGTVNRYDIALTLE